MPKWLVIVIAVVFILGVGAAVTGFVVSKIAGKVVKTAVEQKIGGKFDVDPEKGSVKIKTDEGSFEMGNSATWPAEIPVEAPKFNGGTITGSVKVENAWSVIIKDVEKSAVETYISGLKSAGWTANLEMTSGVSVSQLEKNDLQISLAYESNSKGLNLTVAVKDAD